MVPMTGARYLLPDEAISSVDAYLAGGGGLGIAAARRLGPEAIVDEITASGLRGRGGAGFPTGVKWASVRTAGGGRHYVVANGAEGEPATFKDRMLMRRDPYRVIEGAAIAALVVGAAEVFVATKRSFVTEIDALRRAAVELGESGLLADLEVAIVEGPDEYLFGEEKALLEVIEGRDPLPRLLPPWQHGLFATAPAGGWEGEAVTGRGDSNPTVVSNVETLATAAHVLAAGPTGSGRWAPRSRPARSSPRSWATSSGRECTRSSWARPSPSCSTLCRRSSAGPALGGRALRRLERRAGGRRTSTCR